MSNNSHLHTQQAGAVLPFFQAVITGGLLGLIVLVISIWQRAREWLIYALLTWLIVSAITWLILQRHWLNLTKVERLIDMVSEPYQPAPEQPTHTVKIDLRTVTADNHYQERRTTLPIDERSMSLIADSLLAGRSLTERDWAGAGKPFSVQQVRDLKKIFKENGILEPVNPASPQQGDRLTKAGIAVMKHFSTLPH